MSWLLGISGTTEKFCPEPQGLEDDGDGDDIDDKSCSFSCPPLQCKSYESPGDSQAEDLGEAIPFSLNPKDSYVAKGKKVKTRTYAEMLAKHVLELEEEAQEFQEPAKDMEMPGGLSDDEEHNWTHRLPVHQKSRVLQTSSKVPCGSYNFFQSNVDKHMGVDAFAPWAHASDPFWEYPEHSGGADPHMLHEEAIANRELPFLQLSCDMLREENSMLKRMVRSMQSSLKSRECTMRKREMQLKASLVKEERKVQDLQSSVQWTECNLQLMTQRALAAESNVEKLKQEIFILRGELDKFRVENENLRAGQTVDLGAVKHNMDFALQNLHKIITGANWSITQLISGVESLHFVAEVLKSTGKISEVGAEKEL